MSVLVLSISHRTATLDQLAQLALPPHGVSKLVHGLLEYDHIDEAVVLSTCNRTEVYAAVGRFHGGLDDICHALSDASGVPTEELPGLCSVFYDEAAVAHLFNVTAGLESMVVGENQILGQVRAGLGEAQQAGAVGSVLNALFQQALRVGKRVQHETSVGSAGRSLMSAALTELHARGVEVAHRRAAVIGAGSMAALAAHTLVDQGASVTVVNRTWAKAERLAGQLGCRARPWSELAATVTDSDLVVSCTGAVGLTFGAEDFAGTDVGAVIDLGLPADVDPMVADRLTLVNLASLRGFLGRPADVEDANTLVAGEVADFMAARRAAQVTPTVVALRRMAADVVSTEMARLDAKAPQLSDGDREAVRVTVNRVVDKLLHQPTVRVQAYAADDPGVDYAAALRDLFALDPQRVSAVSTLGPRRADGTDPQPRTDAPGRVR